MTASFDLDAYLMRIGFSGARDATLDVFHGIHRAHAMAIPFENIDILNGVAIATDIASVQGKLVNRRRGGYCFEQNMLLAEAFRSLGFTVRVLAGRVRLFGNLMPRTHVLLEVTVDGVAWVADVGFGGVGPIEPVPIAGEVEQSGWLYRVVEMDDTKFGWVLQCLKGDAVVELYSFTEDEQYPADIEVANYYTSTYPTSMFRNALLMSRPSVDGRHSLFNSFYTVARGTEETTRQLDEDELRRVIDEVFDISVPANARLRRSTSN